MKPTLGTKISAVIFVLFVIFVGKLVIDEVRYNMQYRPPVTTDMNAPDWPCVVGQPDC